MKTKQNKHTTGSPSIGSSGEEKTEAKSPDKLPPPTGCLGHACHRAWTGNEELHQTPKLCSVLPRHSRTTEIFSNILMQLRPRRPLDPRSTKLFSVIQECELLEGLRKPHRQAWNGFEKPSRTWDWIME